MAFDPLCEDTMSTQQPAIDPPSTGHNTPSDHGSVSSKAARDVKGPHGMVSETEPALASQESQRMEGVLGDAILRFLRIRKGPKLAGHDPDAVRWHFPTQDLTGG